MIINEFKTEEELLNTYSNKFITETVEILDRTDQINVDTNVLPRFDYKHCPGKMVPKYYTEVKRKISKYKN